mmetsp:Transcript_761/g.1412  ORF Transcript_761/g.1412 Transcript_761/m.1412 type:complete len:137 (+) Transcript_761:699-1109(+)
MTSKARVEGATGCSGQNQCGASSRLAIYAVSMLGRLEALTLRRRGGFACSRQASTYASLGAEACCGASERGGRRSQPAQLGFAASHELSNGARLSESAPRPRGRCGCASVRVVCVECLHGRHVGELEHLLPGPRFT